MRNYAVQLTITSIIVLICTIVGQYYEQNIAGWGISIVLIVIWGLLASYNKESWIITSFWYIMILFAYLSNLTFGAPLLAISTALGLYLSVLGVRDLFQDTQIGPLNYIIRVLLGKFQEADVVESPSKGVEEVSLRLIGPRSVIVKPNTAVILERGSVQTRVAGPETFVSQPFEYVKRKYNLKPIHKSYKFMRVLTQDLIATTVNVDVTYGVDVSIEARLGERALNEKESNALRRLDSWAEDWEAELRSLVEKHSRRAIGALTFSQAIDTDSHYALIRPLYRRTIKEVRHRGIQIYNLSLVSVQPYKSVSRVKEENWLVTARADTMIKQEEARGEAWRKALIRLAQAYTDAQALQLPKEIIYQELLRRVFEQAALDPTTRDLLPEALGEMLSAVQTEEMPQKTNQNFQSPD